MSGMNFYKKFLSLFLALALCISLAACGNKPDTLPDDDVRTEATENSGDEEPESLPDNNATESVLKDPIFEIASD